VMRDFGKAQRDLDEAMTIATRDGMRLFEADCHLGFARLYLDMKKKWYLIIWHLIMKILKQKDKARESLAKAKKMIDEMGYHRRDGEVKELEEKA